MQREESERVERLRGDVAAAEGMRQKGEHGEVETVFRTWATEETLASLEGVQEKDDEWRTMAVGMAGLARIEQVDANSQMKETSGGQREAIYERRVQAARWVHERIGTDFLPGQTITGDEINWRLERAQDEVSTHLILGDREGAVRIASEAITASLPDGRVPAMSARAVLYARKAKLTNHLATMRQGLVEMYHAHKEQPNPHRLATLAIWTAAGSVTMTANLRERVEGVVEGVMRFRDAMVADKPAAMSALEQFMREGEGRVLPGTVKAVIVRLTERLA